MQPLQRELEDQIFWFVATNFSELCEKTSDFGLTRVKNVSIFNRKTVNAAGEAVVLVVKEVLEAMLRQKESQFDREKLLMNVNELKLTATPFYGQEG